MLLCLDIGNSHIFGGVFVDNKLALRFRYPTYDSITSDQLGIFLRSVLRENKVDPEKIARVALCSVVPTIDYSLRAACKKYFNVDPFILDHTVASNLKNKTKNPANSGADIIAGIIAATDHYPRRDLIVVDLGTVTTIAAVTKKSEYLGVTFIPGVGTAMNSLQVNAAKLFSVEIIAPQVALGRSTVESIQAGLFFGHLGAIKEIISRIINEVFSKKRAAPLLIATGGFAHLFGREKFFYHVEPDLVLQGLKLAYEINHRCGVR